ncbi:adenylate/guanylate cyclase domain-containing protein [uncultured Phenylobacterium sp.]|uniref:adenylate/guanylate cyclase domain-containing protein n=1 Tax=uncultured Phenylobacterium sp. TaxID=349273 RepID=UPI0025FC5055|nr:adenylate/guanylate cyclase domain-containing protein [uncultured Phenylobacterium sp.]
MTARGPGAPAAFKLGQRLDALLLRIINRPAEEAAITQEIQQAFTQRRAVLVLDMSGFSRVTQAHGIVAFLVMIMKMRGLSEPIISAHNGDLVKAEGDNLFCLFPEVDDALSAALEIMAGLEQLNHTQPEDRQLYASAGIGYGDVMVLEHADLFGDEVNKASKLGEDIARRGEILLTAQARARLQRNIELEELQQSISKLELTYFAVVF